MKPVGLLVAAALMGACSRPLRPAEQAIPPGWSRISLFTCCSVAGPPGAAVRPAEDEIDTEAVEIRGTGLSGTVALVDAPGVERPPGANKRVAATERAAGREFETIRYVSLSAGKYGSPSAGGCANRRLDDICGVNGAAATPLASMLASC